MKLSLPIDAVLPDLVQALKSHSCAVFQAPTGAGKTTRVPPALLDAGILDRGRAVLLEPRRLAARAAACRMASERGTPLGTEIGYHVRFDRRAGPDTRILAVTPGILLQMMHHDPYLETVSVVLFDEFHERGLENDLALGIARLLQQTVRSDLKIVAMSATLDTGAVTAYLGGCTAIVSEGRLFPVEIRYEPKPEGLHWPAATARAVTRLLEHTPGDLLVFLPGLQEIRQTVRLLEPLAAERDLTVVPLYGDLPPEQQDAALLPAERRKVVLATNVAETSVTVEGVTGVVDTGLARALVYDPAVGLDRLKLVAISKASAEQRAGRAGRTQPGVCVRLWSESSHIGRRPQTEPEIRRADLAGAVLHLLTLGESDVFQFPWLEPPPAASVNQALTLLRRLGALADGGVTELGRALARLPVHPRLGRLLIEGQRLACSNRAALSAALLTERDPFTRNPDQPRPDHRRASTSSDVLDRVEVLEAFASTGRTDSPLGPLNRGAARQILQAKEQLLRSSKGKKANAGGIPAETDDGLMRSLLAAFPDRLAKRRAPGSRRGVMVGGRGVVLAPSSGVTEGDLFLCIDVDAGRAEALVRQASAVERDWLPPEKLTTNVELEFDQPTEKVVARRRVRFDDLVIEDTEVGLPGDDQIGAVLAAAAAEQLERVRPAEDSPAGAFLVRVRCLREWMPELNLPAFGDEVLRELLPWLAAGCKSFADLRRADWLSAIQGRLTHSQRQAVEREAPERIAVPSGSKNALRYEAGRPPVLAVRIQELFGLTETPRIAGGRVRVLLHLLAPNYRPQQVTDDLASFWANTYPQVRKELRTRYPKHAWPEDPLAAEPQRRPKRRP